MRKPIGITVPYREVGYKEQKDWNAPVPLHVEDEYVRKYLWERALIAIEDPCARSHPHENMNEYCQHKTKLAKLQSKK